MIQADQKLLDYLKSTIADKERELLTLEGELSALRSIRSTLIVFRQQDGKNIVAAQS